MLECPLRVQQRLGPWGNSCEQDRPGPCPHGAYVLDTQIVPQTTSYDCAQSSVGEVEGARPGVTGGHARGVATGTGKVLLRKPWEAKEPPAQ